MSSGFFIKFNVQKFSTTFFPSPSIFKASFDIKCFIFSIAIFSHSNPTFVHLLTASCFFVVRLNSFTVSDPHEGQFIEI